MIKQKVCLKLEFETVQTMWHFCFYILFEEVLWTNQTFTVSNYNAKSLEKFIIKFGFLLDSVVMLTIIETRVSFLAPKNCRNGDKIDTPRATDIIYTFPDYK
jgi:hypothetical protein